MAFISIHTLVKRATRTPASSICTKFDFNPRPREKGDLGLIGGHDFYLGISIHALVKRATVQDIRDGKFRIPFQSTPS